MNTRAGFCVACQVSCSRMQATPVAHLLLGRDSASCLHTYGTCCCKTSVQGSLHVGWYCTECTQLECRRRAVYSVRAHKSVTGSAACTASSCQGMAPSSAAVATVLEGITAIFPYTQHACLQPASQPTSSHSRAQRRICNFPCNFQPKTAQGGCSHRSNSGAAQQSAPPSRCTRFHNVTSHQGHLVECTTAHTLVPACAAACLPAACSITPQQRCRGCHQLLLWAVQMSRWYST